MTRELLAVGIGSYLLGFALNPTPTSFQPRDVQAQAPKKEFSESSNNSKAQVDSEKDGTSQSGGSWREAIPLPQIADRAHELNRMLRDINTGLAPRADLLNTSREADAHAAEIRERARETKDLLSDNPMPMELEDEHRYWRSRSDEYRTRRKVLAALAAKFQGQIETLDNQLPEWEATWDRIQGSSGISSVLEQVLKGLEAIRVTRSQVREQLNSVLTVQNQLSQQDQQVSDILVLILEVRERELSHLLEPDSRPLWAVSERRQFNQTAGLVFYRSFDRSLAAAREFLRTHKLGAFGLLISYLLALFGVCKLRLYVNNRIRTEVPPSALRVMNTPFSVALLLVLLLTAWYGGSAPLGMTFIFYLLFVIPVLRLFVPMLAPRLRGLIYMLAASYTVAGLYQLVQLPIQLKRELHAVIVLATLLGFGWLMIVSSARHNERHSTQDRAAVILKLSVRLSFLLLTASLIANIAGYVPLSQVLSLTLLVGPFMAAALYCAARILTLLLTTVLRTPLINSIPDLNVDTVERWAGRFLTLSVLFLWVRAMLHLLTIYDQAKGIVSDLFQRPIGFEKVNFTLAGVLSVVVILLAGYILANALTFFLKNFVLTRWRLKRGVPYAISKVTYYACLLLVGLAALSATGVELNKFTVLTGAFGVGLGFGMQNIVNNFVSGLILIFERPIHVGDIVDVGGLEGRVRRIGARSSTVVTFQGAEVIVPNSNLLSNQLINWTLSSQLRRIDIPVRAAYGTDPEKLTKLLVSVAESHPGVVLQRPPEAFFRGFGESALNFELRFWSAQQDAWFQLQSDVSIAVAKALREAGIEIPFPQRDLHVRSINMPSDSKPMNNDLRDVQAETTPDQRIRA